MAGSLAVEAVAAPVRRPEGPAWLASLAGHANRSLGNVIAGFCSLRVTTANNLVVRPGEIQVLVDLARAATVPGVAAACRPPEQRQLFWTLTHRLFVDGVVAEDLGVGTRALAEDVEALAGGRPVDELPGRRAARVPQRVRPGRRNHEPGARLR